MKAPGRQLGQTGRSIVDDDVIGAVQRPGAELAFIILPEQYLKAAGAQPQRRVVAAGLRLAALLP